MKYLLILLLFTSTSFSQLRDSITVKNDIFEVCYSEKFQQPLRAHYIITCYNGKTPRKGMDFYVESDYKTSDSKDYENNIYDKGHLVPAADFNCDIIMLRKTFSYLNCSLQNKFLNRGVWKTLETYERKLSKKYVVEVEVKLIFSTNSLKLKSGATVPDAFIKTIKYNGVIEKYYFPNKKPKSSNIKLFIMKKET